MNAAEKARLAREQAEKEAINLKKQEEQNKQEEFVNKKVEEIAKTKVGKIVTFGKYPQKNQNDPIEWIVIENVCGEIKLLSKYILDCHEFISDEQYLGTAKLSYETSSIRKFLNGEFYNKAFMPAEQEKIKICQIDSHYDEWELGKYCSTTDKVYLLSEFEIHKMKKKFLKTKLTKYAKSKGDLPRWWIRDVCADWDTWSFNYMYNYWRDEKTLCLKGQFYFKGKKYGVFMQSPEVNKSTNIRKELSTRQDLKSFGVRPVITLKLGD